MNGAIRKFLVQEDGRLILLLTPPFDKADMDPGYIKGYLPGVRENGAQYTHAALWVVQATAMMGNGDRAFELFQMINPLERTSDADGAVRYRGEPYVVAADVYNSPSQHGRGGWTWYTGSASWMYRVGLETILGFAKRGDTLRIEPRVPRRWTEYSIEYRHRTSVFAIRIQRGAVAGVTVDGMKVDNLEIPLVDDGARHEVIVTHCDQVTVET